MKITLLCLALKKKERNEWEAGTQEPFNERIDCASQRH